MLLILLAYLGGALTILSPCILPVLPFVFSTAGQSFRRGALPLLAGMVLMFALVASLAVVGGGWVVQANQYGRWLAMGNWRSLKAGAVRACLFFSALQPAFYGRPARAPYWAWC
jgi:hypothetical protein